MTTAVMACETIRRELTLAMEDTGINYPVYWLKSGLHNVSDTLRACLSETIAQAESAGVTRLLAAMGFCGNSHVGVETGNVEVVLPRVDDCISLLLGSMRRRRAISEADSAYFLTQGWMQGERNIWVEYQYCVDKYGEKRAREIFKDMFGGYRTLALLDSDSYPIEPFVESTKIIAETLQLEQKVVSATRDYLAELLRGPWNDERFVVIAPGSTISEKDLTLPRA